MRNYVVQLFDTTQINSEPKYKIALSPHGNGAQGTKDYSSKEAFASDLKERLGCSERFIEGFFTNPKTNNVIQECPLTDEDAAYFGWNH
ncbi:MAG: hypothetical protein ABSD64_13295 [Terriglobales bacterium]|jgi:hypothetical protein